MNQTLANGRWRTEEYCLAAPGFYPSIAGIAYNCVCRKDYLKPGFFLVDFGPKANSQLLRRWMLELERRMLRIHQSQAGRNLSVVSAGRFDQQTTTRLHRDGGPEESFLMLGYEPTEVDAQLSLADYTLCAHQLGLTPEEFLRQHNPLTPAGEAKLEPFVTQVACFAPQHYQILLINNSMAASSEPGGAWQGVLHRAVVRNPSADLRRVVNSMMVASAPLGTADEVAESDLESFTDTPVVHRRGYDKPDAKNDG